MKIELSFFELPEVRAYDRPDVVINSAIEFVMANFFPEFEEPEIFGNLRLSSICYRKHVVSLTVNPVWLRRDSGVTLH